MLAGLALTAATVVTLSSDALARGGFGGMRSFSAARTPVVVNRVTSSSAVRRTSTTSHTSSSGTKTSQTNKTSQTKMHSCKKDCSDHHHKPPFNWMPPMPPMPASGSPVSNDTASQAPAAPVASVGDVSGSAGVRRHRKVEGHRKDEDRDDRDGGNEDNESPQDSCGKGDSAPAGSGPGGSREVVVNDGGGTRAAIYPVATSPNGSGNTGSSGTQGSGGTISKERPNPTSAGTGAAAASAPADAPNCVYERTVQRLPDGRLQRVVLKVCPDA